jgi:hypothetical protein
MKVLETRETGMSGDRIFSRFPGEKEQERLLLSGKFSLKLSSRQNSVMTSLLGRGDSK